MVILGTFRINVIHELVSHSVHIVISLDELTVHRISFLQKAQRKQYPENVIGVHA